MSDVRLMAADVRLMSDVATGMSTGESHSLPVGCMCNRYPLILILCHQRDEDSQEVPRIKIQED